MNFLGALMWGRVPPERYYRKDIIGKILLAEITVGTSQDYPKPLDVIKRRNRRINVVARVQGFPFNFIQDQNFYSFGIDRATRGCSVLDTKNKRIVLETSSKSNFYHNFSLQSNIGNDKYQCTTVQRDQTNQLLDLFDKLSSWIWCQLQSYFDLEFSVYLVHSLEVVALGVSVVVAYPSTDAITLSSKPLKALQKICIWTSMAVPHVGATTIIKYHHHALGSSGHKSALITTATRLSESHLLGDEFSYGAGVIQPL